MGFGADFNMGDKANKKVVKKRKNRLTKVEGCARMCKLSDERVAREVSEQKKIRKKRKNLLTN